MHYILYERISCPLSFYHLIALHQRIVNLTVYCTLTFMDKRDKLVLIQVTDNEKVDIAFCPCFSRDK